MRERVARSRADIGYAALWITVIAAHSVFSIGAVHWFSQPLATWMADHRVTEAAITDTLIIMAVAMALARAWDRRSVPATWGGGGPTPRSAARFPRARWTSDRRRHSVAP